MPAQIRIDQEGLPEGTPGVSRTDGLDTGALVTLTNTGSGSTTAFRLLWVPPGDTTAVATLEPTDDPRVWTFAPTPGVYGSYRVELVENQGLTTELRERRILAVRTPGLGVVIPALGERGDSRASLVQAEQAQIDAAENNAVDYPDSALNAVPYAAWWRALHELAMNVDAAGGIPPGTTTGQPLGWTGSSWQPADNLVIGDIAAPLSITLRVGGSISPSFHLGTDGGEPTIAFFGGALVGKQSITGSTTSQHVDSLVAALVALGLVTDNRTS